MPLLGKVKQEYFLPFGGVFSSKKLDVGDTR
jgi:hypothetical protein